MALSAGSRVGPYEIISALGTGGMAEVYRARDPRPGRDVAIKIVPETPAGSAPALERFEREAGAVADALDAAHGAGIIHRGSVLFKGLRKGR